MLQQAEDGGSGSAANGAINVGVGGGTQGQTQGGVSSLHMRDHELQVNQLREHYNVSERVPTNYYYKRWLWVQFPWACLSLKCDYSMKMKKCFSSATKYMR